MAVTPRSREQESFDSAGGVTVNGGVYSGAQPKFTSGNSQVTGAVDVYTPSGTNLCQGSCAIFSDASKTVPNPPRSVPSKAPACFAYEIGLDGNGGSACTPTQSANTGLIQSLPTAAPQRLLGNSHGKVHTG